jgi:tetratricopeptide (TPR) repeat protein
MYKIMLSSTYIELQAHRQAVREAMLSQRIFPIAMEDDAALPDQDLIDASLAKVNESDAYVGLISYRYGQTPKCPDRNPRRLSLTELEFRCALARNIPICMFIMHGDHPVPRRAVGAERGAKQKYNSFVRLAKKDRIYAEFKSVDDLKTKAVQSLVKLREVLDKRALPGLAATRDDSGPAITANDEPHSLTGKIALSNVPIRVPEHFLGRDKVLAAIETSLARIEGRVAITAVHGLRGVGKTTLAAAYAENHRGDYRATWWIWAQTEPTMRADLVALGVRLGWVGADEKEEPALKTVMERLRHEGDGLLLIYDNAIDAGAVTPYLPLGGAAKVLVTSNAHAWHKIAQPVEINTWPKEIGADFLIARTGREAERAAAEVLSDALGGLPLAHEQAAAYCEGLDISLGEYRKRFESAPARFLDDARHAPTQYGRTVAKTFALAIDEAAKLHPAAEPLIVYAALLAPEPIPLFLFAEAREKFGEPLASALEGDGIDEAVAALRTFALLDREPIPDEREPTITTDCIRLHRLVRQVAAARREGEAREEALHALIEATVAVYPRGVFDYPKAWPRARRLDAIAMELVGGDAELPKGAEEHAGDLLNLLASYRHGALAAYAQARPLFERALAIYEKVLGPEHPLTAPSLNNLALLLYDQGDYAEARQLFERALTIVEKTLGPDHPNTAKTLNSLALLLQTLGDLAGARPLLKRALAIYEKVLGPEHPLTATSLNNLALLLEGQGNLAAARPLHERALAIREKVLGSDHPDTANSLNNLAILLHNTDDHAAARPLFERSLAIHEKALGLEHPNTNRVRGNLARLLLAFGDPGEALALGEAALAAHEKVLGQDHPMTKNSASVTADALAALGRADEAAALRARHGLDAGSRPPP